jgi:glycosyltransferase 2 family protein
MALKKPSPRVQLILGILVSLVFLYFAVKDIDPGVLWEKLQNAHILWTLPTLLIVLGLIFLIKAWRWTLILKPVGDFRVMQVFPAMMIGFMGNNIYPAHLGEFLRAYVFAKHENLPFSTVFSTLVMERVFDLIAILSYFYLAVFLVDAQKLPELMKQGAMVMLIVTVVAILGMIPFILAPAKSLTVSRSLLSWLPSVLSEKILGLIEKGSEGLQMARSPKLFLLGVIASYVHWLLYGVCVIVSLQAFEVYVTIPQALFLEGVTAFAVTIPASPGFFGVIQAAFTTTLDLFGVEEEPALAASFYYHLTQYIPVTVIGLYYLKVLGININAARDEKVGQEKANDGDGKVEQKEVEDERVSSETDNPSVSSGEALE